MQVMKKTKDNVTEWQRLSRPSFPLPLFTKGAKVQVYLGAGWSTGSVVSSYQDKCQVTLITGNRTITVTDARSIRSHNND